MADGINWNLLQPVDIGGQVQQGFATGMALVKTVQRQNALRGYLANPDDEQAYNALAAYDPGAAATIQNQQLQRRKLLLDQQDRQRQTALGQLYNTDPAAAHTAARDAGDFDLDKTFSEMDKASQAKTADFWEKAGSVAFRLRGLRSNEERAAYWQQARPILEAQGAPADLLDKFDPNNPAQLDAAIATSQKVSELWQQGKPQEFNVGPGEGRYSRDPITGEITTIIAPNAGGHDFGAPVDSGGLEGITSQSESAGRNFDANGKPIVSPAGARYAMQTMPGTARDPGFGVTPARDDSPEEFNRVGREYLGAMHQRYGGDLAKMWGAYNWGPGNLDAAIERYGDNWLQAAPPETRAYVQRNVAKAHHDTSAIRAAANRAIAAGADPVKVRERAAAQGVNL